MDSETLKLEIIEVLDRYIFEFKTEKTFDNLLSDLQDINNEIEFKIEDIIGGVKIHFNFKNYIGFVTMENDKLINSIS